MEKFPIKVGFCVAYDWYLLKKSLPLVYEDADEICLSVDKDQISWAGVSFDFDEQKFREFIEEIDKQKKIKIFMEDFHRSDLTSMQNEVRQRNMMASFLGKGGWHIQLDADEYFVDFKSFVQNLYQYKGTSKVNICVPFITLFKKLPDSWLIISTEHKNVIEYIPVATLQPGYEYGRNNGYFNHKFNNIVLHQSWARSEQEIETKVKNWGHKNDFDVKAFLNFWHDLSKTNYTTKVDFHPIKSWIWPSLKEVPGCNIEDVVHFVKEYPPVLFSQKELKRQNSINRSRIKALLKRVGLVR